MKNLTKITHQIQRYVFINLVFMMLSAAVVCAQNASSATISGSDGVYPLKKNSYAQGGGTDVMNEKKDDVFPGLGSELNKIAKTLFNFMVNDASSSLNAGFKTDENFQGFALTSSYINDQLLGGMKLEFYANPLKGGGALMFKKTF